MNIFGLQIGISRKADSISLDTLLRRLEAAFETVSGIAVTPETAMQSPTVHAVVTAISRRVASLPVHVFQATPAGGRIRKERVPDHPVEGLLARPNSWQTSTSYWLDATSWLVRYGRYYAFKGKGLSGPVRLLQPLHPGTVEVTQDDKLDLHYMVNRASGAREEVDASKIHHVRGPARDGVTGDSPIMDVREAIALEIAAEKFGASFFGNGAMPGLIFQYVTGSKGHRTEGERDQFIRDFQDAYGQRQRFRGMIMPAGIEVGTQIAVENDKAQFLETRKLQRNIIAGALGVPPHLAGDLERATFSNIEHQSIQFIQAVIFPICKFFESAMERDLLSDADRAAGVIIRFNLDGALRGDFKSRQEGLKIQREMGVISPNDWREMENQNPIAVEDGGEAYWSQGPSGQGGTPAATDEPVPGE